MKKILAPFAAIFILSACSTSVVTKQEIPAEIVSELKISDVKSSVASNVNAPFDLNDRLEQAIYKAISSKVSTGTDSAKITVLVTHYEIVKGSARAFAGAFAGSNKLYVTVTINDASGKVIGQFDVSRDSNPGGYGMFYDQEQATIDETAQGVADAIFGKK